MRTFASHTDACEPEHGTFLFAFPGFFFVHSEIEASEREPLSCYPET